MSVRLPDAEPRRTTRMVPDESSVAKPAKKARDANPSRIVVDVPKGHHVYVVKACRTEGNIAAWLFLVHDKRFTQAEFDGMVVEAQTFVNEVRIPKRRDETARHKVSIGATVEEAQKNNDILFEQDADFMEIMMIDRFGFKKLIWTGGQATLIPTITGLG